MQHLLAMVSMLSDGASYSTVGGAAVQSIK